ncbi:MAG TPA: hypothetical protein VFO00_00470 [Vitreimonas sp.]|nr:hypothetical protein [Vitreimonas sp.]
MRAFLGLLFDLFGEPGAIAARGALDRRGRALLMPWLRAGEAFLRRLLFIEALALVRDFSAGPSKARTRAPRQRRLMHFYPDKPEDWRVSFRVVPPARRRSRGGRSRRIMASLDLPPALCAPKPQQPDFQRARALARGASERPRAIAQRAPRDPNNAWPVAERIEALLRAYNGPERCARRIARLLVRDEQRALRALRPEPANIVQLFGAQSFGRCNAIVAARRRKWERAPSRADTS